jgi:SAM-dependent methyltransferase
MGLVPPFSQQNIALPDGTQTLPGRPLSADEPWMAAYLRTLALLFDPKERSRTSVADVGCLEGAMAVEFARAGYEVTGVEIRAENVAKCEYVANALALPNLRFVQDDAHNLKAHGPFDAVFCSGLLYHLDDPAAFLGEVAETTRRALLLETHYSTRRRSPSWSLYKPWKFSRLVSHEGNKGRWFREYGDNDSAERVEKLLWSSYGNSRSFWLEKRYLIQTLRDVGFSIVYEQYDFLENNVTDDFIEKRNRSLFVAIR